MVIALFLPLFAQTGLFLHSVNSWNSLNIADQTYVRFVSHFTRANKLCVTALTSADLKFANSNLAKSTTYVDVTKSIVTPPRTHHPYSTSVSNTQWYYCWSHRLGTLEHHTGFNCRSPKSGHICQATVFKRQGGSTSFTTKEDCLPCTPYCTTSTSSK